MPFPCIYWWCKIYQCEGIVWDVHEHFEKMTYRNRYYIAGAGGLLKMTLPIAGGREHKSAMKETCIATSDNWQTQHWRTILSVYNNAPYFDYYAPSLEHLFLNSKLSLADFNLESFNWLCSQLNFSIESHQSQTYEKNYGENYFDLRFLRPGLEQCDHCDFPPYYQVFQERTGFLPNLSLLDLLFSEGPYSLQWIKENGESVIKWAEPELLKS